MIYLKGKWGELKTNILNKFSSSDYIELKDLYLPNLNNDKTTQIDHLLLSKSNGNIVVVETKNYNNCLIKGDLADQNWQLNYSSNKVYDTYNPLKQNYGHIKVLQELIEKKLGQKIPLERFKSIVYINGKNTTIKITDNQQDNNNKKENNLFSLNCLVNNGIDYLKKLNDFNKEQTANLIDMKKLADEIKKMDKNKNILTSHKMKTEHNKQVQKTKSRQRIG